MTSFLNFIEKIFGNIGDGITKSININDVASDHVFIKDGLQSYFFDELLH